MLNPTLGRGKGGSNPRERERGGNPGERERGRQPKGEGKGRQPYVLQKVPKNPKNLFGGGGARSARLNCGEIEVALNFVQLEGRHLQLHLKYHHSINDWFLWRG